MSIEETLAQSTKNLVVKTPIVDLSTALYGIHFSKKIQSPLQQKQILSANENGHYSINNTHISFSQNTVFFDGDTKIANVIHHHNTLAIYIYTKKNF